jgi:acyl-CoA synthetase (NDP forming)
VDVNKSVSFGNGVVLDSTNYLEYFGQDPEITVIGMYLEGVRDGRRFFKVLREITKHKPVLIWKGGRTEEGWRAVASHTGSLALPQAVWESAVRQCGAINVSGMQELIDTMKALIHLPPVYGNRVAITGGSGGQSVAIADVFAEAGLSVPQLSQDSYDELATFFSLIGGGYRNPIDTGNANRIEMKRIMNILEQDTNTDNLVLLVGVGFGMPDDLDSEVKLLATIRKRTPKPVLVVAPFSAPEEMRRVREVGKKYQPKGIPVFPSIERGAIALRNAFAYYRQRNGSDT